MADEVPVEAGDILIERPKPELPDTIGKTIAEF